MESSQPCSSSSPPNDNNNVGAAKVVSTDAATRIASSTGTASAKSADDDNMKCPHHDINMEAKDDSADVTEDTEIDNSKAGSADDSKDQNSSKLNTTLSSKVATALQPDTILVRGSTQSQRTGATGKTSSPSLSSTLLREKQQIAYPKIADWKRQTTNKIAISFHLGDRSHAAVSGSCRGAVISPGPYEAGTQDAPTQAYFRDQSTFPMRSRDTNPSDISYLDESPLSDNNESSIHKHYLDEESPPSPSHNNPLPEGNKDVVDLLSLKLLPRPYLSYLDSASPPNSDRQLPLHDIEPMPMPLPSTDDHVIQQQHPGAYAEALGTHLRRLDHIRFSLVGVEQIYESEDVTNANDDEADIEVHNHNDYEDDIDVYGDDDGSLSFNETTAPDVPTDAVLPGANNNNLAVARAIENNSSVLMEAEELDPKELQKLETEQRKTNERRMVGYCIIVICSIILGLSLGLSIGRNEMTPSASQPTVPPARSSTRPLPPMENLELLHDELPEKTKESLNHNESPQYRAWEWLLNHPSITTYPEWRKKQVFAMVTFYYSFEGPNWPKFTFGHNRWVNPGISECSWPSTRAELSFFIAQGFQIFGESGYEYEVFHPCNQDGKLQSLLLVFLNLPTRLTPSIPPEIELLTSLKIFGIHFSQINVKLSDMFVQELVNLQNLEGLFFYESGVTGGIPQEVFAMTDLRHLVLGGNQLDKTIPTEIALMSSLEYFNVHNTEGIGGKLPSELGLMTTLTGLEISWSSYTGTIPTELGSLTNMRKLTLDANRLSGAIPSELGLLTGNTWLALYENRLTGSLPSELGLMTNTARLRIWNTGLTGSIPSELGLMTNIVHFRLGNALELEGPHNESPNNNFSGSLPSAMWDFSHMEELFLPNLPNLRGSIPGKIVMPNLTLLSLSGSPHISGTIPDQVCLFVDELDFDCSDLLCGCDCHCAGGRW